MPTIYAASTDGYVRNLVGGGPSWATVRDATSGNSASSTSAASANAVQAFGATAAGGRLAVWRSFFAFDVSGISTAVASATINIRGTSASDADIIGVRATKPDTTTDLTTADFDAITGFSAGNSMAGNVTDYTSEVTTWSTSGYNNITLNATALSHLESLDTFIICFVEYDHDYLNSAMAYGDGTIRSGMIYQNSSGTSRDPSIDYTLVAVASVDGVAIGNITKIDGIAKANIASINGVGLP